MKATLYTLPSRHVLVLEDGKGGVQIEYPPTSTRGEHIAQDAGAGRVEHAVSIDALVRVGAKKANEKIKMV